MLPTVILNIFAALQQDGAFMKKAFKISGFFFLCFASFFLTLNLFFSAVFLNPLSHNSKTECQPKKILCFVKYTPSKNDKLKGQELSQNNFTFDEKKIIAATAVTDVTKKNYFVRPDCYFHDLYMRHCCLLI